MPKLSLEHGANLSTFASPNYAPPPLLRGARPSLAHGQSRVARVERARLVVDLMHARRDVGAAIRIKDVNAERLVRQAVNAAKRDLGERGPRWWSDGSPDHNRRMVRNLPYEEWYAMLGIEQPC